MMTLIHRLRKRSGTYIYHNQAQYCSSPQMNNLKLRHYISIRQRYCTSLHLQSLTRILGDEKQFWAVIGVRPDPELAGLRVQGKLVKPHRADEGDVGGLAVQHVLVRVYPQARQLWQHVDHFIRLEVVDENVGQPEVLDELQVHRHHHVLCRVVWPKRGAEGGEHVQPSLPPLHVEVGGEGDAVVLVVDAQDLVDVDGHAYHVCLFCECRGWEKDRWTRSFYLYMEAQILNNCREGRGTLRCQRCIWILKDCHEVRLSWSASHRRFCSKQGWRTISALCRGAAVLNRQSRLLDFVCRTQECW